MNDAWYDFAQRLGYDYGWPIVAVGALILAAYLWHYRRRNR